MVKPIYQDPQIIENILKTCRRVAVVGLSPKPDRPSYGVSEYLIETGYDIIPVNPTAKEVFGKTCYPNLIAIPDGVDLVTIFRRPEDVPEIVEEAIAKGAKAVWMQFGVINDSAAERAHSAGLDVVMDCCMSVEHGHRRRAGKL